MEIFTYRYLAMNRGDMIISCFLEPANPLRNEYRLPKDLRFLNWLGNVTKAIELKEAGERRSRSQMRDKWTRFMLLGRSWFRDYAMTRTIYTSNLASRN